MPRDSGLVECVPNISEGRRPEVIRRIVDAARVPGNHILDVHSDADHHRSVITMAGGPEAVADGATRLAAAAAEAIDLRVHKGVHPRIGALDVLPFVPLGAMTMEACIALARRVGRQLAERLDLPVYYYGDAALRPERRRLADLRRGGYEELARAIAEDPARRPDEGPSVLGPAGAIAVGARGPLIAFNAHLATTELAVAQAVARALRESSGGLKGVQALGFPVSREGVVQVSLNITQVSAAPLHEVVERLQREAAARGVQMVDCELVGLMPLDAVLKAAGSALLLPALTRGQVIELALADATST